MPRLFRIPWGKAGLLYVVIAPILMGALAIVASDKLALKWAPSQSPWAWPPVSSTPN